MAVTNIAVSSRVEVIRTARSITQKGVHEPTATEVIGVYLTNQSGHNFKWVNVTLIAEHNYYNRVPNTESSNGYVETRIGFENSEVQMGSIDDKKSHRVVHAPAASRYHTTLREWSCARVYGQTADGELFENWFRAPVSFGVKYEMKPVKCFVATAAYQDTNHPMVQELRYVRDELLSRSQTGRRFTAWYYRNGPALAAIVESRPSLRAVSRCILTPVAKSVQSARRLAALLNATNDPRP